MKIRKRSINIKIALIVTIMLMMTTTVNAESTQNKNCNNLKEVLIDSFIQINNIIKKEVLYDNNFNLLKSKTVYYGLGNTLKKYINNDNRDYNWYIDQGNTGQFAYENCGPSSAAMAVNWYYNSINKTAEDARSRYWLSGGWWYTYNIEDYLKENNVPVNQTEIDNEGTLIKELDKGKIIIMCIDTGYIPYDSNSRKNKFYEYSGGHFIVVKGYAEVDDNIYFEVYDPNNQGKQYGGGQYMGKDRYFDSKSLLKSAENWWKYILVVG